VPLCETNHTAPDRIISHEGTKRACLPSPVGEDMEPNERSELGVVGEGLRVIDSAVPCSPAAGKVEF
jgi:hypothetical protein